MSINEVESTLSPKERALVGVALSVASGCKPCTEKYVAAASAAGACKRGIRLAIESALVARQQATDAIAQWAESLQGERPELDGAFREPRAMWQAIYTSGAAFAQRDSFSVAANIGKAQSLGATRAQILAVLAQSRAISQTSAEHAEAAIAGVGLKGGDTATTACGCGCSGGC